MGELIQHFSGFDIQEYGIANGIDVETIKKSVERSRKATANIERHANAGWWESLKNRALNNDKKAFSEAIQALGELSEIQLAFTMLGAELSRKTQSLQEEINKSQSQFEYDIAALLVERKEQDEFIDDIHKILSNLHDKNRATLHRVDSIESIQSEFIDDVHGALSSLEDKNKTALHRVDSIESMLMDIISADATLRDYKAVNKVGELLKDAISTHNKIKDAYSDVLIELTKSLEKTQSIVNAGGQENLSLIQKTEARINERLSSLSTRSSNEIRSIENRFDQKISNAHQEISNLWGRVCGQIGAATIEIEKLGARSLDRINELNSFINDTNEELTKLVLLKKKESDQEISNLWDRVCGRIVEINREITTLGARSFDRMDELDSFIKNTNDGLTRLVLLKKEESDLSMQKGFDQLDASRKHMGQVLLVKIRKHVKSLIESDERLDNRITESTLAQTNEINAIKAELARVQIWAKLITSFALVSTGWIIYTSLAR